MALPASAVSWKLFRFLIRTAGEVLPATAAYLIDQLQQEESVADLAWVRWNVRYSRYTPPGTIEDKAQFKIDLLNLTGGSIDTSWTAGDFGAVKTAVDSFLSTMAAFTSSQVTAVEHRAYAMRFNVSDPGPGPGPKSTSRPFADTGPPVYVNTISIPGTGGTGYPYQVAASVTLKTGWPGHWGRIYLPGAAGGMAAGGRWVSTYAQALANAAFDLNDDTAAAGFVWCVPVTQVHKQKYHALTGIASIVVDDIPDVQRRRRPRQAALRAVGVE